MYIYQFLYIFKQYILFSNPLNNFLCKNIQILRLLELTLRSKIIQMTELEISKSDERIGFGQLFGMSDHISFNLSDRGYNVAKYLPFGPVKDVMPYLIRRAEENTSVAGQTTRELSLLKKERKRRKI